MKLMVLETLSLSDVLMISLTAAVAIAVIAQAVLVGWQAKILKDADRREEGRQRPNLMLKVTHRHVDDDHFVSFTITNASPFDVTVQGMALVGGAPAEQPLSGPAFLVPRATHYSSSQSEYSLPHRLKYGEAIEQTYAAKMLIARLTDGDGEPVRARFQCVDSLGHKYMLDHWYTWEWGDEGGLTTTVHSDPGPGLVPPEVFSTLS